MESVSVGGQGSRIKKKKVAEMPKQKNKKKKVADDVKLRSEKKKDEGQMVHMIAKKFGDIYTRNIFDAFRLLPDEPKRLILKAYRIAFAKDERRMEELEETHPKKKLNN